MTTKEVSMRFLKEIGRVLIRQVGDNRQCPQCRHSFIPHDVTSEEALKTYNKLKTGFGI